MPGQPFKLIRSSALALFVGVAAIGCASHQVAESTVAEVVAAKDDTKVVVTGAMVELTDREHFLLSDSTGQINVEVDEDILGKVKFAPDTRVRVVGTVDRDSSRSLLKADSVTVLP